MDGQKDRQTGLPSLGKERLPPAPPGKHKPGFSVCAVGLVSVLGSETWHPEEETLLTWRQGDSGPHVMLKAVSWARAIPQTHRCPHPRAWSSLGLASTQPREADQGLLLDLSFPEEGALSFLPPEVWI